MLEFPSVTTYYITILKPHKLPDALVLVDGIVISYNTLAVRRRLGRNEFTSCDQSYGGWKLTSVEHLDVATANFWIGRVAAVRVMTAYVYLSSLAFDSRCK